MTDDDDNFKIQLKPRLEQKLRSVTEQVLDSIDLQELVKKRIDERLDQVILLALGVQQRGSRLEVNETSRARNLMYPRVEAAIETALAPVLDEIARKQVSEWLTPARLKKLQNLFIKQVTECAQDHVESHVLEVGQEYGERFGQKVIENSLAAALEKSLDTDDKPSTEDDRL